MASIKEKAVVEVPASKKPKEAAPVVPPKAESVYSADELAANHKLFKTSYDIVAVALRKAGKESATYAEASNIIENFKNREVK